MGNDMTENQAFISEISVKELRNLQNIQIKMGGEMKHLVLTGKNGSGKTTFLSELCRYFERFNGYSVNTSGTNITNNLNTQSFRHFNIKLLGDLDDTLKKYKSGEFTIVYFDAKRSSQMTVPQGIQKLNLPGRNHPRHQLNHSFLQYIVNLKAERSFAKDDNEEEVVKRIDAWFSNFESKLGELFGDEALTLHFDRKNYTFTLRNGNGYEFGITELSDGYSALLSMISEILLRIEQNGISNYDTGGIVLIDEIETHLHVDLQKNILPFLTDFFPNMQFIVTTHSPFVLQSISNSVVYDLEKKIQVEDLSAYSYDALVESYFQSDKYSAVLKDKVARYEELVNAKGLGEAEQQEKDELNHFLITAPKFRAEELEVKLQQIHLNALWSTARNPFHHLVVSLRKK